MPLVSSWWELVDHEGTKGTKDEGITLPQAGRRQVPLIGFSHAGIENFPSQLRKRLTHASLKPMADSGPHAITVWNADREGIRVTSRMHDIGDRLEVGVLEFAAVDRPEPSEDVEQIPESFPAPTRISKLLLVAGGFVCESGIVLMFGRRRQIIICAGAFPYTLAVRGLFQGPHIFEPEYALEEYGVVAFE